jgi:hypothetical protein
MHTLQKKILTMILLLSGIELQAQIINWDKIELAGAEAKILESAGSPSEQNQPLIIQTFDTKEGKIIVYLPPLSPSVTISGTVYLQPTGKDSSRNLIALQSKRLSLGDLDIPVQRGSFRLQLPVEPVTGTRSLQLRSSNGEVMTQEPIPVTITSEPPNSFTIPPYIVSGDQAIITGNFDGNMTNTSVTINGEKTELLAESPSRLYFTTSSNQTGNVTVVCTENGNTQMAASNLLKLDLSAGKTSLVRGEKTEVHVNISGLEGLKEPVHIAIKNTSPSVIILEGGNTQDIILTPRNDAPSGVFVTTRNIQSLKNGSFSVSVTIIPFSSTIK